VVGNSRPELAASHCKRLGGAGTGRPGEVADILLVEPAVGKGKSVAGVDMLPVEEAVDSTLLVAVG